MMLSQVVEEEMRESDNVLDAVVCVLAAADFVNNRAISPEEAGIDPELAKKEGWIWVKPDILREIIAHKKREVAALSAGLHPAQSAPPVRGFARRIGECVDGGRAAVIAEIKQASPSAGVLRGDFDPAQIAAVYQAGGAACLSVLTDEKFFHGSGRHLQQARAACGLPVLRKDFIIDRAQVAESRALGADCVLLIAAALPDEGEGGLAALYECARGAGMDVLVEVHNRAELARALPLADALLGINNRDLRTFRTDIKVTMDLLPGIPPGRTVVTESGIHDPAQVRRLRGLGVHAFLVGEALMRAADPAAELGRLFAAGR